MVLRHRRGTEQDRVNLTWPLRFRVNAPVAKTLTHQVDSRLDNKVRTMGAPSSSGWLRKKKNTSKDSESYAKRRLIVLI
jgi:hypothetical protein